MRPSFIMKASCIYNRFNLHLLLLKLPWLNIILLLVMLLSLFLLSSLIYLLSCLIGTSKTRESRYSHGFSWQQSWSPWKARNTSSSEWNIFWSDTLNMTLYTPNNACLISWHVAVLFLKEGIDYAEKNGMFFIETSAKTADNINQLFEVHL